VNPLTSGKNMDTKTSITTEIEILNMTIIDLSPDMGERIRGSNPTLLIIRLLAMSRA
jgi:hypothetical protein